MWDIVAPQTVSFLEVEKKKVSLTKSINNIPYLIKIHFKKSFLTQEELEGTTWILWVDF